MKWILGLFAFGCTVEGYFLQILVQFHWSGTSIHIVRIYLCMCNIHEEGTDSSHENVDVLYFCLLLKINLIQGRKITWEREWRNALEPVLYRELLTLNGPFSFFVVVVKLSSIEIICKKEFDVKLYINSIFWDHLQQQIVLLLCMHGSHVYYIWLQNKVKIKRHFHKIK